MNNTEDPLHGQGIPLDVFLRDFEARRDAALQSSTRSSEQESVIRCASRIDLVPGLAPLRENTRVTYQEIDELMLLLDLLKDEATQRVLGEDTYPGTIIGKLQTAAGATQVST